MTTYADDQTGYGFDRTPPADIDAERAVLGSMALARTAVLDVVEVVDGIKQPFHEPHHETIFNTMLALFANGQALDPITLANQLQQQGDLDRIGGPAYIQTLVNSVPTAAHAQHYAEILRNLALLRAVISTGTELVQMGFQARANHDTAAHIVDTAAASLQELTAAAKGGNESREWLLDRVVDAVLDEYDNPRDDVLPLPWADVQSVAPMEPGDLVVIAGRPAMGKSLVLLGIGRHVAIKHRRGVLIASMEMSHVQMGQRLVAAEAQVPLHALRSRTLNRQQYALVRQARDTIRRSPLRIDDTPAVPVSRWRRRLRQLQSKNELPAALIVDYLQIAKAETKAQNRVIEVDSIAVGLKALAQEFKIVVIAAAQLNRVSEHRTDKTPTLSDLRESGGIENNANIVILLHREDYYDRESPRAGEFDFVIAKNRMGHNATVTTAWQGHYARIVDMEEA
ncbi:replicative DNA helicase [Streptomyces sp. ME18-1-4]|uniref:replicative DNA helicase n=1 Tax=Streptomyces sp. ME18-1-4 TaxID=3028685 RepID=UPI0029B4BCCB|nr:replicative DNA helicase [Streptomyces sp. ME18-1-4]MDX3249348.1 replicative DNA helicase [Streptomyces sp. ME18-1-4]